MQINGCLGMGSNPNNLNLAVKASLSRKASLVKEAWITHNLLKVEKTEVEL